MALFAASCGGGDGAETGDPTSTTGTSPSTTAAGGGDSAPDDAPDTAVAVPIARFTAHGPQAANTIGPGCADGIDTRGGDVFRFTPLPTWSWQGTTGGSGSDEVSLDADGVRMYVTESAFDYDTAILPGWEVVGPSGVDLDIDGVSVPMMEIRLEGAPGYAIVDLPYLGPLPQLGAEGALGTVAITSDATDRPTLDEAEELLGSVRIERCEAVSIAMIWGPAGGVHLVPRFDPDPLGKLYPDQPQPAFTATPVLQSYSLEQIAYLMPVTADVATCAAEKAREVAAQNPIGHLMMLTPSGTNKQALADIVALC